MAGRSRPAARAARGPRVTGRLTGRRLLVVGGGTRRTDDPDAPMGNGRAIAVLAAQEGAAVAVTGVDEAAAQGTVLLGGGAGGTGPAGGAGGADAAAGARGGGGGGGTVGGLDALVVLRGIA